MPIRSGVDSDTLRSLCRSGCLGNNFAAEARRGLFASESYGRIGQDQSVGGRVKNNYLPFA